MSELIKMNMEDMGMSVEEAASAGNAVLDYLDGLSEAEYLFAEYGIRIDGCYYE